MKKKKKIIKLSSQGREIVGKPYPWRLTGTRIRSLYKYKEDGVVKDGCDSYPKWAYQHILDEHKNNPVKLKEELNRFCFKLNGKKMGRKWEQDTAYELILKDSPWITKQLKDDFRKYLFGVISNEKDASDLYMNLCRRVLKFFINQMEIKDPSLWKSAEFEWGQALMNEKVTNKTRIWEDPNFRPSESTLNKIVQVANRFLKFVYKKENEATSNKAVVLTPFTKTQMKTYLGRMVLEGIHPDPDNLEGKYFMSEVNFNILLKHLRRGRDHSTYCNVDDISPYVSMCYFYGLRRSEAMALTLDNVKNGFLSVEAQALKLKNHFTQYETGILKGKNKRKTPHWFISNYDCYSIISLYTAKGSRVMHPDTFTALFTKAIKEINLESKFRDDFGNPIKIDFTLHDLRRTFITRALRLVNESKDNSLAPVDVQLAVGHKDINTTLAYQMDDRALDERTFKPGMDEFPKAV